MDLLNILFSVVLLFVIIYFLAQRKLSMMCIHGSKTCKDENGIDIQGTCNKSTLTWECSPGTSNTQFLPGGGCECSDDINLTCAAGKTMQVNSGFYGRNTTVKCTDCPGDLTYTSTSTANDSLRNYAKKNNAIKIDKGQYYAFFQEMSNPNVSRYTTFKYRCV
jgi:hypothetical protein